MIREGATGTLKVADAGEVPYGVALGWQDDLHRRRVAGDIADVLLLVEHPHVYTLGRRFSAEHLLEDRASLARRGIEVYEADRGGSITYHGPGQLVGYPIVALVNPAGAAEGWGPDAVAYLRLLEQAVIQAAGDCGVTAGLREGLTGVWVGEEKLASIGVNVSRGVTKHGFALNVSTDLSYFAGMVPCGIPAVRVTSLARLLGMAPPSSQVRSSVVRRLAGLLGATPQAASVGELGLDVAALARCPEDRMRDRGTVTVLAFPGSAQGPPPGMAAFEADGGRARTIYGQS